REFTTPAARPIVRSRSAGGLRDLPRLDIDVERLLAAATAEQAHLPGNEGADQNHQHDREDRNDTAVAVTGVLGHGEPPVPETEHSACHDRSAIFRVRADVPMRPPGARMIDALHRAQLTGSGGL